MQRARLGPRVSDATAAATGLLLGLGALVTLALTIVAFRAVARTGDRRLVLLGCAFAALTVKGLVAAWSIRYHHHPLALQHGVLEVFEAAMDLVAVLLLATPLLVRRA